MFLDAILIDLGTIRCQMDINPLKAIEWLDGLIETIEDVLEDQENEECTHKEKQ